MKKFLFAVLFAGTLAVIGSTAQARDGRYDEDRYGGGERYRYRNVERYDRRRYNHRDDVVIVRPSRRAVYEDDYRYRPRYSERRHHRGSFFQVLFGF
ncbi:MAG TPA: hypothetical protein VGC95_08120 [Chitinophagaceae bacterium]